MFWVVPPVQMAVGLFGWVLMAGSATTVMVAVPEVIGLQSLPVAVITQW